MKARMPSLRLKPSNRPRVLRGHPWVFANEIERLLPAELDGEAVLCKDARGRLLGSGIYNSRSQIAWRRFARGIVALDEELLRSALASAISRRRDEAARRLVWSDSDGLPGLIVDQYGDLLAVQAVTLAMDKRLGLIGDLLHELLQPRDIVFRNDVSVRQREGLEEIIFTRSGNDLAPAWLDVGGVEFGIDLTRGQKTGLYLDQREEHRRVAAYAPGRRVLDAFCNQGGFALHAARAGAASVQGVDNSAEAIEQAERNAERNGLQADFTVANVFDFLRQTDETWDLIVLDPPPFGKSRGELSGAARGYKEVNLRAMKQLSPGGILATYSCSHHFGAAEFLAVLGEAAADARREVRVLEFCHQPPDHPVLPGMPESEYLRGFILHVDDIVTR